MKIIETKRYFKAHKKLSKKQKKQVEKTIEIFKENPFNSQLKNHPLKGTMKNLRAISAANNLRIIYREEDDHIIVIMIDVGTHSQVY
jgi:mRNA interferase YafQ